MPQSQINKQGKKDCFDNQRDYNEVISYLDQNWHQSTIESMHKIHVALGNIAPSIPTITITGTSGKSTTIYYLSKLLQTEGLKVGIFSSPHFTLYNERFSINNTLISHDAFTKIANTVFNIIQTHKIKASSKEILTAMSLIYFKEQNIDVALVEQNDISNYDPTTIYSPKIVGITRLVTQDKETEERAIFTIFNNLKKHTYIACADQSKILLQKLANLTEQKENNWIMPIRKVAPLPYPYEQLHGRCAALAERIAQVYSEIFLAEQGKIQTNSLLRATKKQRGRPRLTSIKETTDNLNLESFWKENTVLYPNSFQIVTTNKQTVILDNAHNIDALQNLLLGIRLLNYQKPWKNISILVGSHENNFNILEFIKTLRYFFKKNSGNLTVCPVSSTVSEQQGNSWDLDNLIIAAQNAKIKIATAKSFNHAYETISKTCDSAQDLIVITGSQKILSEYWHHIKAKNEATI